MGLGGINFISELLGVMVNGVINIFIFCILFIGDIIFNIM